MSVAIPFVFEECQALAWHSNRSPAEAGPCGCGDCSPDQGILDLQEVPISTVEWQHVRILFLLGQQVFAMHTDHGVADCMTHPNTIADVRTPRVVDRRHNDAIIGNVEHTEYHDRSILRVDAVGRHCRLSRQAVDVFRPLCLVIYAWRSAEDWQGQ